MQIMFNYIEVDATRREYASALLLTHVLLI